MKNISEYLHDKYGAWGWVGQRAHDASGINSVFPLDFIVSCDYGADTPLYFAKEDVFSMEKNKLIRKDWSNEDLNASLQGAQGRDIFDRWNEYKKPVNLLCYRSIGRLETSTSRLKKKPRIFAMPERMKRNFDDKILLHRILPELSLPRIPGEIGKLSEYTFNFLRRELKLPFVVQFPYGSSGHFTFVIREESEYKKLRSKHPTSTVIIRKYINGFSLNVNAVVISAKGGVKVAGSFPSIQIVGVPECSNSSSSYCGNDYAAAQTLDKHIIDQVEDQLQRIGIWMGGEGYRGIFGMDFMVKDGKIYAVEINPRFQNSTGLYTALDNLRRPKKRTLFLLHIAELLQDKDKELREYVRTFPFRDLMRPLEGSQIIVHNRSRRAIVAGELLPGVYNADSRGLNLRKEGATLNTCASRGDILITCGVPRPLTVIEPDAAICKVQMLRNVLNPGNKRTLTPEAKKIIAGVYNKLELKATGKVVMRNA